MRNDASHALTATLELQIQFPSTRGKTIQKLIFQPLVKWQNRCQMWNLRVETSSGVYLVHDSESKPLSGSASNCMSTVRVPSQTTLFFTIMKPIQYQIEYCETLVKNPRSIPHESLLFGQKMTGKPQINNGSSPEKVVTHRKWWVWLERSRSSEFENGQDDLKTRRRWTKNG